MSPAAAPLRARLYRSLGPRGPILRKIVQIAVDLDAPPYLVGGPVRDLLARRHVLDLDLLLPDRLEAVARAAATRLGGRTVIHGRFLTATLLLAPDLRVDLSRARRERYPRPGALPVVAPGVVEEDLGRRDFTINAMALPLHPKAGSAILDPFGGRTDLRARRLSALHERSFIDDPTRLLRAARYAARFDLAISPPTARWLRAAVRGRALDTVSGDRVTHEIERLLDEHDAAAAVRRTARWGLFRATVEGWSPGGEACRGLDRLARCRRRPPWPEAADPGVRRAAGLSLLLLGSGIDLRERVLSRLGFRGSRASEILENLHRSSVLRRTLPRLRRPGARAELLDGAAEAALLVLYCSGGESTVAAVRRYARRDRRVRSPLDGHVARGLGAAGPEIGALLRASRLRRIDGQSVDEGWARRWLARRRQ